MERCPDCGKKTIVKEMRWENGRSVIKRVCCNSRCKSYKPLVWWGSY